VTFVIRVFKPANHRSGCADQLGELLLSEARTLAEFVDLARDRVVRLSFCQFCGGTRMPNCVKPGQKELSIAVLSLQFKPPPGSELVGGYDASAH
jgi:hypothetical protein